MILYHISTDLSHDGTFIPAVPESRMQEEEDETKRICVATTIEGCFSALPSGGSRINRLVEQAGGVFRVFHIDTEVCGIADEAIWNDIYLYEEGLVPDAEHTGECWILEPFTCAESHLIMIDSFEEESADIIPYPVMQLMIEEDADYDDAYEEIYGEESGNLPCMTVLTEMRIWRDELPSGGEVDTCLYGDEMVARIAAAFEDAVSDDSWGTWTVKRPISLADWAAAARATG